MARTKKYWFRIKVIGLAVGIGLLATTGTVYGQYPQVNIQSISFGAVTPNFTPQVLEFSSTDCWIWGLGTVEVYAEPDRPEDAYFSDPTQGPGFPVSQLEAWDNYGQVWNPLTYGTPRRLDRVSVFFVRRFSFRFRLRLNGDEPAGSYSATVRISAVYR